VYADGLPWLGREFFHPGAKLLGGVLEHLAVELETDRRHVPGLLVAQQVARAADLEGPHRNTEARAELRVVGERRQASRRLGGERFRRGIEQVGEGALAA